MNHVSIPMAIPNAINTLLESGQAKSINIPANQVLFSLGSSCEQFVIVKTGSVRVELLSTAGQQMLLYRIDAGHSCVMTTSCLLGNSQYFAQAITETAIELIQIPRKVFSDQLMTSIEFRDYVFNSFHERFAGLMERTTELVTSTVDQRLAAALLEHVTRQDNDSIITQTHQQLSVEIGSAREVVSRRLANFEDKGLIKRTRGEIEVLNIDKLKLLTAQ